MEHTRYIEEHPDWSAYMRDVDLPKFVSYVLYRIEIPRAYLGNPGCMRISVTASLRYSMKVEEARVALGTALMDTDLRPAEKSSSTKWGGGSDGVIL